MGSSRLPGKVMKLGADKPLLGHLVERLLSSTELEKVIIATTTEERDDTIVKYCGENGIPVFRGSENDVLDRYYQAARAFGVETIVRVTSDCPLIDTKLIDETLRTVLPQIDNYDLVTNRHPLTFIDGIDFDVIPIKSLELAWQTAREKHQREHVVPFFWDTHLRVKNFDDPRQLFFSHRWTLDYQEDYELISAIYQHLYQGNKLFETTDILQLLSSHPELMEINSKYLPKRPDSK
jgi:spore coat polysaccharide biosynthesis protein SpsF